MALEKNHKWIIAIFAIVVLLVIAYFIYKYISQNQAGGAPVDTTTTTPGLLSAIAAIWGGGSLSDLFGGGKPKDTYVTTGCDPDHIGYNLDGLYDNNCQ